MEREPPTGGEEVEGEPKAGDDDLVIERHERDSSPEPDDPVVTDSSLVIVRDLVDDFATGTPPPPPTPTEAPAPPPDPIEEPESAPPSEEAIAAAASASAAAERRRELFDVDWEDELRSGRRRRQPTRPITPRAAQPAPETPLPPPAVIGAPRVSVWTARIAAAVFVLACSLLVFRVEPVATWFYLFTWYPFLLILNHGSARISPERSVFRRGAKPFFALLAWSVPTWLFFEIWNFRLEDWYYVGVPDDLLARRLGVSLSFATVLPAFVLLEEYQRVWNVFATTRSPRFPLGPRLLRGLTIAGGVTAVLVLAFPTIFYPLVWGVPVLLLEPWLVRRGDRASLMSELARGRPARTVRLLVAGLWCGLLWEAANWFAVGKWIYTVPGLDAIKLFEMPPFGFVGFAPFALCCWSVARALVRIGLLPEWDREGAKSESHPWSLRNRVAFVAATIVVSLLALEGMDRWTIDSRTPRPRDVPGIPDGIAEYAERHGHDDVQGLLGMIERGEIEVPGDSGRQAIVRLGERCRLVLLRGIGTANAERLDRVGVRTVSQLAARDPTELTEALAALDERGWRPRSRRVEVWTRAARSAR